jgi:hypothetical protein
MGQPGLLLGRGLMLSPINHLSMLFSPISQTIFFPMHSHTQIIANTQIKYVLRKCLHPVSTKLFKVNLFLHKILRQNLLPICSVRRMTASKYKTCLQCYVDITQAVSKANYSPSPHTHIQRKENFNIIIINDWYLLSGSTISAGNPLSLSYFYIHTYM